jgi:dUTP pyrophosphatase
MIKVYIVNESNNELPSYATEESAGMDLRAFVSEPITLKPLERKLISTGIRIKLPQGYEAQIRPRSGLALKKGISICNAIGTIDSDYTGIVGVILINLGNKDFIVNNGDRIAQMIINKYEQIEWKTVDKLEETERGNGGFGHTGVN